MESKKKWGTYTLHAYEWDEGGVRTRGEMRGGIASFYSN